MHQAIRNNSEKSEFNSMCDTGIRSCMHLNRNLCSMYTISGSSYEDASFEEEIGIARMFRFCG